jgi:hypothetical protein
MSAAPCVDSVLCELLRVWRHQRSWCKSNAQPPEGAPLELLGSITRSVAEDLLVRAQAFDSDPSADLVRARLAAAPREIVEATGPPIEVIRITTTAPVGARSKLDRARCHARGSQRLSASSSSRFLRKLPLHRLSSLGRPCVDAVTMARMSVGFPHV